MYLKRYIENKIKESLEIIGVVVISGPKYCGKTTTSKLFAKTIYTLDTKSKIEIASINPKSMFNGETPILIDEWQTVPDLWNVARSEIDSRENKFGQFIFTGSSTPANKNDIYHNGAGRILTLKMYPLTLSESNESKKIISLKKLFNNEQKINYLENNDITLEDIAFYICRGGWPLSLNEDREKSLRITRAYCSTLFEFENTKNNKFRNKKKEIFNMIIKSYARNISTEARKLTIIKDINSNDDRNLDLETLDSYLEALNDLYIIQDINAWNLNLRSKTSIITTPTRHFVDTSIAAYSLNISPNDLLNDIKTFGLFFEDFVIKELNVYSQIIDGEISHYRDSSGLECDAVIHLKNGKYGLIEIKLGGDDLINEGIKNLIKLESKIKESNNKLPAFKIIITACGPSYLSKEDIAIVPINLLTD